MGMEIIINIFFFYYDSLLNYYLFYYNKNVLFFIIMTVLLLKLLVPVTKILLPEVLSTPIYQCCGLEEPSAKKDTTKTVNKGFHGYVYSF